MPEPVENRINQIKSEEVQARDAAGRLGAKVCALCGVEIPEHWARGALFCSPQCFWAWESRPEGPL